MAFCLLMTGLNLWGISWISKLSAVFFVLIYMPFIAEAISAPILYDTHWEKVGDRMPFGDIQWSLFLSTVLWCFGMFFSLFVFFSFSPSWFSCSLSSFCLPVHESAGGFDSIGSVAGEVKGGRRTFILGISASVPIVVYHLFFSCVEKLKKFVLFI